MTRTIERRIATMENTARRESDRDRLSEQELASLVVDQLEEWARAGLSLEQMADGLMGLGYDEEARTIPYEFEWDAKQQVIREIRQPSLPRATAVEDQKH